MLGLIDLVTTFLPRARPVDAKKFQETFSPLEDGEGVIELLPITGNSAPRAVEGESALDAWYVPWLGGLELLLLFTVALAAMTVLDQHRLPRYAPLAAVGLAVLAVVNLAVPFGSTIEWARYAALYVSAASCVGIVTLVGTAWCRRSRVRPRAWIPRAPGEPRR